MSNIPKIERDISSVLTEKTSKNLEELTAPAKTDADRGVSEGATPRPNHYHDRQPISSCCPQVEKSKVTSTRTTSK